jgi:putative Mn2+ efflux pump MntP
MLISQLVTGLVLGFDSFLVCLALGTLPQASARRKQLALSFGLCDGAATLIGSVVATDRLRSTLDGSNWLGPAAVACYGAYVLFLAWRAQNVSTKLASTRWIAFGLPLCLSVDNLVTGLGGQAAEAPFLTAVVYGVISGGLALLGLVAGSSLVSRTRFSAGWMGAVLLLIVAASLALKETIGG